jgi:hypothetical protein
MQNSTLAVSGHCLRHRIINGDLPMKPFRLFAATGTALARLNSVDGASVQTTIVLGNEHQSREGHIVNGVMCVAVDVPESNDSGGQEVGVNPAAVVTKQ